MDKTKVADAIEEQIKALKDIDLSASVVETGKVEAISDGVAIVSGLSGGAMGEMVDFSNGVSGMILNLKTGETGIIILGDYIGIKQGDVVKATGKILTVTGSYNTLGRVVNPLMVPVDGKGKINSSKDDTQMPVEKIAPGVIKRQDVKVPMQTGIKSVDSLVPVGRGQRQLIIGDRGIGKTAIAIDAIINQAKINKSLGKGEKRVLSIYVAIGQKQSKVAQVVAKFSETDSIGDCVVVAASASDPASLQYLAPFTATALAEYFMSKGEDVLIVYDDLSKHAWAYREVSLLLRRPSGREAYPGDIFYLHSRLLERAARMSEANGGGSITALPIIETLAGDISAYIPTNVISITDGQIYLEPDLFYSGIRPAISVGLSVSRVGGDAQIKAMKQVAGTLKLDLAQYRELAAFAQFGSDLDEATIKRLDRGKKMTEILKQAQFEPDLVEEQIASIWAGAKGHLDKIEVSQVADFLKTFVEHLKKTNILKTIREEKIISPDSEEKLVKEVTKIKQSFV